MHDFKNFQKSVKFQFDLMVAAGYTLFTVDPDRDEIWEIYLNSFKPNTNPMFRERTEHDCSCCKAFIRQVGGLVAVDGDNKLVSIWDITVADPYRSPAMALSGYVKSLAIKNTFFALNNRTGVIRNFDTEDSSIEWNHFYVDIPSSLVTTKKNLGTKQSVVFNAKNVFMRALQEIDPEAVQTILDLIGQGSLYRGDQFKRQVLAFQVMQKSFEEVHTAEEQDNFCWKNCAKDTVVSHIRNSAIGTLLVDLSIDMPLDTAVKRYENVTAGPNYKRPTALVTPRMVEDARATVQELGLTDAITDRRFAVYTDLRAEDMLFIDRDNPITDDPFDAVSKESAKRPGKKSSTVEEMNMEGFIKNVIPNITDVEVLFENKLNPNLMSIIAPAAQRNDEKLFSWNNNFSWVYTGDVADSMKERVKSKGGDVDGVLRFSIQWNDDNNSNLSDLDAHCKEPNGNTIYYPKQKERQISSGILDVDIVSPHGVAVENISWNNMSKMPMGEYKMMVHGFTRAHNTTTGFTAEIEAQGVIHKFAYNKVVKSDEKVQVATVTWDGKTFVIKPILTSSQMSKEVWGIKTEQYQPVSIIMPSPNYWGDSNGNKHWMFILKDCKNPETPRGFYNEYLRSDLNQHRKVFEILGDKLRVKASDDQMSGLGFSTTQRNSMTVRVSGSFKRVIKINF